MEEFSKWLTVILQITAIIGILVTLCLVAWQASLYRKLARNERSIKAKQAEIDAVEPDVNGRTSGHLVNEKQRLAQVNAAKMPLIKELETLERERRFILDKLLFAKK